MSENQTQPKRKKVKWLTLGALLGAALLPVADTLGLLPPGASQLAGELLQAVLAGP